jgi:phage baseplate assembly protein gpV
MDRLERYEDDHAAMLTVLQSHQSELWTALPGIIVSFDPEAMTCEVQPAIQAQVTDQEDKSKKNWVNLPLLVDCPIYFPAGGGCTLTFPVVAGDEVLVVFSSRCIDSWWQSGGFENQQAIMRMHDLSDGFIFVGFRSQPNVIPTVSQTATQLRSDDGSAIIELNPVNHKITLIAPGGVQVTGDITVTGTITASGEITGQGTHLHTHTHGGVQPGSGSTGAPN